MDGLIPENFKNEGRRVIENIVLWIYSGGVEKIVCLLGEKEEAEEIVT